MADTRTDRQDEPSMPSHQAHPSVDRFRMIRESLPSTSVEKKAPSPITGFTTHRVELVRQSYRKNSNQPPPTYIIDDLFQGDIDEVQLIMTFQNSDKRANPMYQALGESTSILIDRSCVYISPQGDVGFLAGPAALDHLDFAAVPEPTQYIFQFDKSRKGIDSLGAWSIASATLPPIEHHEAIYDKLADSVRIFEPSAAIQHSDKIQVKNAEHSSVNCISIVFRSFSDKARKRLLELALPPSQRTLRPIDVLLEDGVTNLPKLEDGEEEPEWEGIRAGTPPSPASPSIEGHGTDEEEQKTEEGDVHVGNEQSDELGRGNAERNRPLQINYDIPPAPMPSAVDPSVFEGFDSVLPPEPDTPSDSAKSPKAPPTPKPEDQQSHRTAQISSPSAIRALFSPSNGVQPKAEEFKQRIRPQAAMIQRFLEAFKQTGQEENEFDHNSVRNARRELAIPEGVRSDTVTENLSVPLPAASAPGSGSNVEAPPPKPGPPTEKIYGR
ncbi:hypothetical protein FRC04_012278 [Tulasnella sp. 424]|nr:hypothetical protein FRC04_012278 [Tulasnella sp. 424]